ncbi:MAG TPA: hypothetical protein VEG66_09070 [Thermoplasmata archaeon]|jgi:hypothetical protein|nr:hypothetical protein [Thermoplasmata archaeon]
MAGTPPSGKRSWRQPAGYALAVAVGVGIGLSAVIIANGGPLLIPTTSPGYIIFWGVQIDIFYQKGTPPIFGPNEQQGCPSCPLNLSGGTTITIPKILTMVFPPDTATSYFLNVTSPIPFEEWGCFWSGTRPAGWPAYGCPFTTSYSQSGGVGNELGSNFIETWPLTLAVPNPAPNLPGGFELQIGLNVTETPQLPST